MVPPSGLPVTDPSQVGDARRLATEIARRVGFDQTDAGRVAIVVTEAATNLVKHGGGGRVVVRALAEDGVPAIDVLAVDAGRGMPNVDACLEDGYSTTGSPGTGLGAIARLSTLFDVYTRPGAGTVVFSRVAARTARATSSPRAVLEVGGVMLAHPGEEVCGDGWAVHRRREATTVVLVDGLGHGRPAAEAAAVAVETFERRPELGARPMVEALHSVLRPTRGAAVAVAAVDLDLCRVTFCGIGNIAGVILGGPAPRRLVSHNGIAGHNLTRVQEFEYEWPAGGMLVLNSDGLVTDWSLDRYPGIMRHRPAVIAAVLARDFARGRDDVTVVAARERRRAP